MRRRELSYLKGATLRRRTYSLYSQCGCHFHMRLFSANSTSCCKMFNPSEEKRHMHLIYSSSQRPNYPLVGAAHEEFALAHQQMDCKKIEG
jgi:hypothetical protein